MSAVRGQPAPPKPARRRLTPAERAVDARDTQARIVGRLDDRRAELVAALARVDADLIPARARLVHAQASPDLPENAPQEAPQEAPDGA